MAKLFKDIRRSVIEKMSDRNYARLANAMSLMKGNSHRIDAGEAGRPFTVSDGKQQLKICRRNRVWLYKHGIGHRLDRLAKSYLLDRITEPLQGAFIDCGANVGELGAFGRARGLEYHAFEPEKLEADCSDMNNYDGEANTNRFGLWSEDGRLTFYSKPSTGDSSLFETEDYVDRTELQVRSLDSVAAEKDLKNIAILKIEAEGAEPEILKGAVETLKLTKYVTVDCGFEKGLKKESTLIPVCNILIGNDFEAVDWNPNRLTVLFRNKKR